MKAGGGKRKGGKYERDCAKDLSIWFTNGMREDVFYRTASSGGRATVRSKKQKTTFGQNGDIQSVDPIGECLTNLCSIECKDGYPGQSSLDLVDKPGKNKCKYGEFFEQCAREAKEAKLPYWLLMSRRKGKRKMIYIPYALYKKLNDTGSTLSLNGLPCVVLTFVTEKQKIQKVYGIPQEVFFLHVRPNCFLRLYEDTYG